jgi:hypothetical protein
MEAKVNTGNPAGSPPLRADDGSREILDPSSPAFLEAQEGCAKGTGGGTAASPAQMAQAEAHSVALSKCMRSRGVSEFPDPQFGSGGRGSISIHTRAGSSSGLGANSPIFQKAQQTCGLLLPGLAGGKLAP